MKTFHKLIASILLILIIFPFVEQIILNRGVEAKQIITTTNRSEEINSKIDTATERATLSKTLYKYAVKYKKTMAITLPDDTLNYFKKGNVLSALVYHSENFQNTDYIDVKVAEINKIASRKVGLFGKEWDCQIVFEATYIEKEYGDKKKTINSFPNMTIKTTGGAGVFNPIVELKPETISEFNQYVWDVTTKGMNSSYPSKVMPDVVVTDKTIEVIIRQTDYTGINNRKNVFSISSDGKTWRDATDQKGATRYLFGGLRSNTTYYVRTKATNMQGNTSISAIRTVTTQAKSGATISTAGSTGSTGSAGSTGSTGSTGSAGSTTSTAQSTNPQPIADNLVKLSTEQKRLYIRGLYKNVLGREPSMAEINVWEKSNSCRDIAYGIIFSNESQKRNKINEMTNTVYIQTLYKFLLRREGESSGVASNTALLEKGYTRKDLITNFVNSNEFKNTMTSEVKTITFANVQTCSAVYDYLKNNGYNIVKPENTKLYMYTKEIANVKKLNISGKDLTDVTGISVFTNLEELYANMNKITNMNEISKLTKLIKLDLGDNNKISLTDIKALQNLKILNLKNNNLTNTEIKELANLTKLEELNLSCNSLVGFTNISGLSNLKVLNLDNNDIYTAPDSKLLAIKSFSMKNNNSSYSSVANVLDVPALAKAVGINNLELSNCEIKDNKIIIKSGEYCKVKVKSGYAEGSTFSVSNISKLVTVNDKVLFDRLQAKLGNKVLKVEQNTGKYDLYINKYEIAKIKFLDLSATSTDTAKITDITGLEAFTSLTQVVLNNNEISNFDNLKNIKGLKMLNIRNNNLTTLDSVKDIKSLEYIDATKNLLTDIDVIAQLPNIDRVVVNDNNISDLSGLANKKFDTLAIQRNKISDIAPVKDNVNNLILEGNVSTIEIEGNSISVPEIVKKSGGESNTRLTNCTYKNNNIVLNDEIKNGSIEIISGIAKGTIINIKSVGDITPPELSVSYVKNEETGEVNAIITSNEPLMQINRYGWTISNDKLKLMGTYKFNASEIVTVRDLAGNEVQQPIEVTEVTANEEVIPGLKISYYNCDKPTKDPVRIIVTADVPLANLYPHEGWVLSEDEKTLTCDVIANKSYTITVQTKEIYEEGLSYQNIIDHNNGQIPIGFEEAFRLHYERMEANTKKTEFYVNNIDNIAPIVKKETQEVNPNGTVTVKITTDEKLDESKVAQDGWIITDGGLAIQKTFNKSANLTKDLYDLAGNVESISLNITGIDSGVDGLTSTNSITSITKEGVKVTVNANEKITLVNNTTNRYAKNSILAKVASTYSQSRIDTITMIAGQMSVMPIMDGYVESVNSEPMIYLSALSDKSVVNLAEENNETQDIVDYLKPTVVDDNTIEFNITENIDTYVMVSDEAGNVDIIPIYVDNIDENNPEAYKSEKIANEDGTTTVILNLSEKISENSNILDWEYDEENLTLTKTFNVNKTEILELEDFVGNKGSIEVVVNSVSLIDYEVFYWNDEETGIMTAEIIAKSELKEIDGWTLSEDKKSMKKTVELDSIENVLIEDVNGNTAIVEINTKFGLKSSNMDVGKVNDPENDSEQTGEEGDNDNKEEVDNTQADKGFPQTGDFEMIIYVSLGVAVIAIITCGVVWIKKFKGCF